MKFSAPSIDSLHGDFLLLSRIREAIYSRSGGKERLGSKFPSLLQDAIDFVLDPVRTARTAVNDLDNVEKTFIGLKVEHVLRDFLDVPKGLRDLQIDGVDVDIKNTVGATWMILPETYRNEEPCLLIAIADNDKRCWLGLMIARNDYLGASAGNRDHKRSVVKKGLNNILWLFDGVNLPASRWAGIDMKRFRELRQLKGGSKRAAAFFRENLWKRVHRSIIQTLLFDQNDYMKRTRGNGGARDILRKESIALLSWTYHREIIRLLGLPELTGEEFMAVTGRNISEIERLRSRKVID
jgi:hypothetical protein